jgi:rubrerythrin
MDKLAINPEKPSTQGIIMGPKIEPIFECPHCKSPHTYLAPQKCPSCGKLVSIKEEPFNEIH